MLVHPGLSKISLEVCLKTEVCPFRDDDGNWIYQKPVSNAFSLNIFDPRAYKWQLTQELKLTDHAECRTFADWVLEEQKQDDDILNKIIFTRKVSQVVTIKIPYHICQLIMKLSFNSLLRTYGNAAVLSISRKLKCILLKIL